MYTNIIILISVKGDKDIKNYITLTALGNHIDIKELSVGEELNLEKDKKNQYDDEAIKVLGTNYCKKGYLANSIHTKCKGTHSVGYIYNMFDDTCKCVVRFIYDKGVIAEIERWKSQYNFVVWYIFILTYFLHLY